jgi:hypothetical protein
MKRVFEKRWEEAGKTGSCISGLARYRSAMSGNLRKDHPARHQTRGGQAGGNPAADHRRPGDGGKTRQQVMLQVSDCINGAGERSRTPDRLQVRHSAPRNICPPFQMMHCCTYHPSLFSGIFFSLFLLSGAFLHSPLATSCRPASTVRSLHGHTSRTTAGHAGGVRRNETRPAPG